jgi:predicted dehydrogenase
LTFDVKSPHLHKHTVRKTSPTWPFLPILHAYCVFRVNGSHGEDVATVMMRMGGGITVLCEISYASRTEHERFPETYITVEGEKGSLTLGPDYWIRVTTEEGVYANRYPPPRYTWADPAYDLVHASIVPCQADLLGALKGTGAGETTGEDNLKTMRLVFAAYESAASGRVVPLV